jgi:hypothetical protein
VLFLGVLYHMKHPLLALSASHPSPPGSRVMQTQLDMMALDRPALAFYQGSELNGDPPTGSGASPARRRDAACRRLRRSTSSISVSRNRSRSRR